MPSAPPENFSSCSFARFLDQPRAVFSELTGGQGDDATLEEVGRRLRDQLADDASLSDASADPRASTGPVPPGRDWAPAWDNLLLGSATKDVCIKPSVTRWRAPAHASRRRRSRSFPTGLAGERETSRAHYGDLQVGMRGAPVAEFLRRDAAARRRPRWWWPRTAVRARARRA
jgi:hypothetical protein